MPKSAPRPAKQVESPDAFYPPLPTDREGQVQQLVADAERLIHERIRNGTASPTETVAVMRLGSEIERVNVERIKAHTEYLVAQREKAAAETVKDELFSRAIEAMTVYQGRADEQ